MKAEIIAVGTELLMGEVTDTNSGYLARELLKAGIGTYYQQTVGDNAQRLDEALEIARSRADVIILSGGLGPTEDDLTKFILADYLDLELVYDDFQSQKIIERMKARNRSVEANQMQQALTFAEGITFANDYGMAAGSGIIQEQKIYIVLPGPPFELQQMMKQYVIPYLKDQIPQRQELVSTYIASIGIGEAQLATRLEELISAQTNPTIAIYAMNNVVTVRVTANAATQSQAEELVATLVEQIVERIGAGIIAISKTEQTLESIVISQLKAKQEQLFIQEAGTGGHLLDALTNETEAEKVILGGNVVKTLATLQQPAQLMTTLQPVLHRENADYLLFVGGNLDQATHPHLAVGEGLVGVLHKNGHLDVKHLNIGTRSKTALKQTFKNEALNFFRQRLINEQD